MNSKEDAYGDSLSSGERAGVRASVDTNFPGNRLYPKPYEFQAGCYLHDKLVFGRKTKVVGNDKVTDRRSGEAVRGMRPGRAPPKHKTLSAPSASLT